MASSIMDSLFQRYLDDLIKSLRSPAAPISTVISKSMDEIRRELKSTDLAMKSCALQKLTYLSSLHAVDMSFASFHVVELMSSPNFSHKKIGYLAGSLSFHSSTDVLLLVPNQLRKDLTSANPCEASLALEFLAVAGTHDLARELTQDIFTLLASAKIPIRKKAIAALLRFYDRYPDSVRVTFKRLVENLDNSDVNVLSAAVGVFCKLASDDPRSYLPLAPEFYRILTESKNNWVLIKVVKIFAKLAPLEPRLAKKLVEPICDIMRKTGAKSLMFECIRAVVSSLADFDAALKLAVEKIRELLTEDDPNLKYLTLQAFTVLGEKHLWAMLQNQEMIIKSLSDEDLNVKVEALRLLMGMVSETNLEEISRILMTYALKSDPEFCNEILGSILGTCGKNVYEIIVDFDWYVSLLGEMARIPHCQKGDEIERQMIDIGLRVQDARPELVRVARDLLIDPALLGSTNLHRVLAAAAWVSGEYVEFSRNLQELIEALIQPRTNLLPPLVRGIYIQSVFKVLVFFMHSYLEDSETIRDEVLVNCETDDVPKSRNDDEYSAKGPIANHSTVYVVNMTKMALEPLLSCDEVEVQERARNVVGLIGKLEEAGLSNQGTNTSEIVKLLVDAFAEELGPVSVNAQERVQVPDGLILKENLADLDAILGDDISFPNTFTLLFHRNKDMEESPCEEPSTESTTLLAEHRQRHGLYYLPTEQDPKQFDDYPPANDDPMAEATKDLLKLTDKSIIMKKPNRVKPRPVVVKLEEGDGAPSVKVIKESKDDVLAGAVRDILLAEEGNTSGKSSQSRMKEKAPAVESDSKENHVMVEKSRTKSPEKRKKHRDHRKEKHKSNQRNEDKEQNNLRKNGHHHGKQKARHRADASLSVAPQAPVIQDFLL